MSPKKKARRCERRANRDRSCTSNNACDLQKTQSPWSAVLDDNWQDELGSRVEADADRLEAVMDEDRDWFARHPDRHFHIREAYPHERHVGQAGDAVLVVRLPQVGRARIALSISYGRPSDYDNDATGEALFAEFLRRADPNLAAVIRKAREVAHG